MKTYSREQLLHKKKRKRRSKKIKNRKRIKKGVKGADSVIVIVIHF